MSPSLNALRKYALTYEGDVARGARLFADEQKLACSKCHSVAGRASKAAPDLFAVGDKFGRRDLVDAVLVPSATISPGYGMTIVETKTGEEYQGILKQATEAGVQLMGADGKLVSIPTADIKEQRGSTVSFMPEELQAGLSLQEFTDLTREVFSERGPNGLLDLAFHPKFRENRKYYLNYQMFEEGKVATIIVEKQLRPTRDSELVITGINKKPPELKIPPKGGSSYSCAAASLGWAASLTSKSFKSRPATYAYLPAIGHLTPNPPEVLNREWTRIHANK